MTPPIARDPIYRRRRFDREIIELCVRWYVSYRLSYRDLVALMAERGGPRQPNHEKLDVEGCGRMWKIFTYRGGGGPEKAYP